MLNETQTLMRNIGEAGLIIECARNGLLGVVVAQPDSAEALADRMGLDPRATALALEVLAGQGLVHCEQGVYHPSEALADLDRWIHVGVTGIGEIFGDNMEAFLTNGKPWAHMDGHAAHRESNYKRMANSLAELGEAPANALAAALPPVPQVLDVGCGSGVFGLAMGAAYADCEVAGLDLPAVLDAAFVQRARRLGVRCRPWPGSWQTANWGEDWPRIILANVLHLESPEGAAWLIDKAASALMPGGDLVVVDIWDQSPKQEVSFYALQLGMRTRRGHVHRESAIRGWMEEAGLEKIRRIDLSEVDPMLTAWVAER